EQRVAASPTSMAHCGPERLFGSGEVASPSTGVANLTPGSGCTVGVLPPFATPSFGLSDDEEPLCERGGVVRSLLMAFRPLATEFPRGFEPGGRISAADFRGRQVGRELVGAQ